MKKLKLTVLGYVAAVALCVGMAPARAATTVTTNESGQVVVTTDLTNMAQLFKVATAEVAANAPAQVGSFATTVLGYFTSFNVDLTNSFPASKGYAYAGVDSLQGFGDVTMANSIVIDYKIWGGLALDAMTRNGGVSGTIISQSLGVAFNLPIKDVNVAVFAHGGYDLHATDTLALDGTVSKSAQKFYGEVGLRAMKMLTQRTFAGVSLSTIMPGSRQSFGAFAGFNF